ncbi:MAG: sialidase family protein [Janthinobacterium lividum]
MVCLATGGCVDSGSTATATGRQIEGSTGYPRIVRLLDPAGVFGDRLLASSNARLFESDDHGTTWRFVSRIPPVDGLTMRCCETIHVLPKPIGTLPAGTLLFAASYLVHGVPAVGIFASADQGRSWSYRGTPIVRGADGHGLWEPEFEIAADGALVMIWSDETDPRHSQKLVQIRTYDGIHWQDEKDTVSSDSFGDRPGMATVSHPRAGRFLMTYEVCGPAHDCAVFLRASPDGWNFGDPRELGVRIETRNGDYLHSSPVHVWSPSPDSQDGEVVVVAKKILHRDGSTSPASGRKLFVNTHPDQAGFWTMIDAPVKVLDVARNACQNYSSALLPAPDGTSILELAGNFGPRGGCTLYVGRGPLFSTSALVPP